MKTVIPKLVLEAKESWIVFVIKNYDLGRPNWSEEYKPKPCLALKDNVKTKMKKDLGGMHIIRDTVGGSTKCHMNLFYFLNFDLNASRRKNSSLI